MQSPGIERDTSECLARVPDVHPKRLRLMPWGGSENRTQDLSLDFAELKRNSISFFDIEKPETVVLRWSRARTRAAKVGKGYRRIQGLENLLYSIGSGQQIDPRYRYGHNLQFYYVTWLYCKNKQPFFYWKFFYKQTGKLFDTGEGLKMLSGFLSSAPPRLCMLGKSTKAHFNNEVSWPEKSPTDDEEDLRGKIRSESSLQNYFTALEFAEATEEANARPPHLPSLRFSRRLLSKITTLEIPGKDNVFEMFKKNEHHTMESPRDGYEIAEEVLSDDDDFTVSKRNLFDEDEETYYDEHIPAKKVIERINSHKARQSYQLAQRLSCKWSTGAGARIGCVRDYPSELQNRTLEEGNLSPISSFSSPRRSFRPSPRVWTPTNLCRETNAGKSPLAVKNVMLHQIATP
ncbi:calmodulin-binding family protein [Actinidia rufa]|uniref:Calmodulin-binding family protein n=1 Tax=Actinidia rufa TaxID=165716 RepID=A0A7J0FZW0_9ERIC|nr:calmodulin-binding family protein [Actinidia rufa]